MSDPDKKIRDQLAELIYKCNPESDAEGIAHQILDIVAKQRYARWNFYSDKRPPEGTPVCAWSESQGYFLVYEGAPREWPLPADTLRWCLLPKPPEELNPELVVHIKQGRRS